MSHPMIALRPFGRTAILAALALLVLTASLSPTTHAAPPVDGPAHLVKDINTVNGSIAPSSPFVVGNMVYFWNGNSLWRSDGTEAGTVYIATARPPYYALTIVVNGTVFFAYDHELWKTDNTLRRAVLVKRFASGPKNLFALLLSAIGDELLLAVEGEIWKTDGTTEGTVLVKSIGSDLTFFAAANGMVYFTTDTISSNTTELWRTDGTPAGTFRLQMFGQRELVMGISWNGALFFTTRSGKLWRSDGSPEGTTIIKTFPNLVSSQANLVVSSAPDNSVSIGAELITVQGRLFISIFIIYNQVGPQYRSGLWVSDGTPAGTSFLKDVDAQYMRDVNGKLFFAGDDYIHGLEVWTSDSTPAGTHLVKDIVPGGWGFLNQAAYGITMVNLNGRLLFAAGELWISDGSEAGTMPLKEINPIDGSFPYSVTVVNRVAFFAATGTVRGRELWKTDGTAAGTALVKDINPGAASSYPGDIGFDPGMMFNTNGRLFFTADDGVHGVELWSSNGTEAGTKLVRDLNNTTGSSDPGVFTVFNDTLLFEAADSSSLRDKRKTWISDGSEAGTIPFVPAPNVTFLGRFAQLGDQLLFIGYQPAHGAELWKTDGTAVGTSLVKDIWPGAASSSAYLIGIAGQVAFFTADDGAHGQELWRTDGTPAGTRLIKDILGGAGSTFNPFGIPESFEFVNGLLYFSLFDSVHGYELWRSDGTAAGTALFKEFSPGMESTYFGSFAHVGNMLFFGAKGQLWRSDGTPAGTQPLGASQPSCHMFSASIDGTPTSAQPSTTTQPRCAMIGANGSLFFFSWDQAHGYELWRSDGTPAGTAIVKDIWPGPQNNNPNSGQNEYLISANGLVFLAMNDGVHGVELWRSDGSSAGTKLVADFWPGPSSANPRGLTVVNDTLLFTVDEGADSSALWRSDGTAAGTTRVLELLPGATAGEPTLAGQHLFFNTTDRLHGYELWALPTSRQAKLALSAPARVTAAAGSLVAIPIGYRNTGQTPSTSTPLVATLHPATAFASDTSGTQPTVSGNTVTWAVPKLGFLEGREMRLLLRVPEAPLGTRYTATLRLGTGASAQTVTLEIRVADMNYLPLLRP